MVLPVLAETGLHASQVVLRVGVKISVGEFFQDFALDFQALPGRVHDFPETAHEVFLRRGQVPDSREVQGDHPDGACERVRPEKAPAPHLQGLFFLTVQGPVVYPETAAHAPCVFGLHVRVDEI